MTARRSQRAPATGARAGRNTWPLVALALALLAGCDRDDPEGGGPAVPIGLELRAHDEVATVAHATLTTAGAADRAAVEVRLDGAFVFEAPAAEGEAGGWDALLVGLKPSTTYDLTGVIEIDGERHAGEPTPWTTGPRPAALPPLSVDVADGEAHWDGYLVLSTIGSPNAAAIVDADGEFVWWHLVDPQFELSRARLSRDRSALLFLVADGAHPVFSDSERLLSRVPLDGSAPTTWSIPDAHHDFVELPDGTLAVLATEEHEDGDERLWGDRILEIAADGSTTIAWSSWDAIPFDPDVEANGWSHANALDYDDAADVYRVSLRNYHSIVEVDRGSGELNWGLGRVFDDFVATDPSVPLFTHEHQFEVLDGGIVVFDNGPPEVFHSRVVEYALDHDAGVVEPVWSYPSDPPVYCFGLGDVTRLPSGNTLVAWSTAGLIQEITPDGEVVFQIRAPIGTVFGYVTWMSSLY